MNIECSLIIPCYNEAQNLKTLQNELISLTDKINGELILVNNGSQDATEDVIKGLSQINPNIVLVNVEKNLGYGHGITKGLQSARGKFCGWTHADGQTDLSDVIVGFQIIKNQPHSQKALIMGSRRGRPFSDVFFTFMMGLFESLLFGRMIFDVSAQPKIMETDFFKSLKNPPLDFSLDLFIYVSALKHNLKLIKFTVYQKNRIHGQSTWNRGFYSRLRLIQRIVKFSLALRFKHEK